jgi:hypothetical protein
MITQLSDCSVRTALLAWSSDGKILVTAGENSQVDVWSVDLRLLRALRSEIASR